MNLLGSDFSFYPEEKLKSFTISVKEFVKKKKIRNLDTFFRDEF